jgi:hypothetical protein
MRNIRSGILMALLALLMLTACENDNATLLTDGLWTFEDMSTDSNESAIISLVSLSEAILTGATLEFQEDGTYILRSALVELPTTGQWELIGDDRLVMEPDGESSSTSSIQTLSKNKLSYSEDFLDAQQKSYTVTTTWGRD